MWAFVNSFRPSRFRAYWLNPAGLRRAAKIAGGGLGALILLFALYAKDLPSPGKINAKINAQTTKFWDRTHTKIIYEVLGDKNRSVIAFDQMPANIKNATIAIEDRNFYKHGAFSFLGIIRASFVNLICRCGAQGGSTITQQYVKNALLSPERSLGRKIKELILSIEIEFFYSKNDILKLYLNEIPYGGTAYGIEAACRTYFPYHVTTNEEICAAKLTLDEAALLAAIPRAPTTYSPYGSHVEDRLIPRQHTVLDKMAEQGYITTAQAKAAYAEPAGTFDHLPPTPVYFANVTAPHFVLYLQEQLEEKYGAKAVTEGGLDITTTLDLDQQKKMEEAVARGIKHIQALGGSNVAMVAADPKTGQVTAMVGSYNFNDPKFGAFNVATAGRQPGSAFKPLVYSAAFGKVYNYGPGSTVYDVVTDFGGGYKPQNFGGRNYGVLSLRQALGGSLNIPAVKTLYLVGIEEALNQAHNLGITTLNNGADHYGLALTLGAGEVKLVDMVNAYSAFATGGLHYNQAYWLKVKDQKGKTLEEFKPPTPKRVLDSQVAYLISNILTDNPNRAFVFGNLLAVPGHTVAVKTGTTEHYNDAWTIGYTPSIVVGAWAGNNNNAPMSAAAAAIAIPVWKDFLSNYLAGKADEPFIRPAGIKSVTLDANTGKLPAPGAKTLRTDIFPSWYKPANYTQSKSAEIDKVSGKLATNCTPDLAKETVYTSEIHAEIPPSDPAYGRWEPPVQALAARLGYREGGNLPTESDDAHSCSDTKPAVNLTTNSQGGGTYKVKTVVTSGTFTANKLEVFLDDQIISTQTINGSTTYEFNHTITANGGHQFKAVVTDAGYYQATDVDSVTVTDAGSFTGVTPADDSHQSLGLVTYSWSELSNADSYRLYRKRGAGSWQSSDSTTNSQTLLEEVPGHYRWYVEAYSGSSLLATTPELKYTIP